MTHTVSANGGEMWSYPVTTSTVMPYSNTYYTSLPHVVKCPNCGYCSCCGRADDVQRDDTDQS